MATRGPVTGGRLRQWLTRASGDGKPAQRDDLAPTLARIAAGDQLAFHHHGAIFMNRENLLPMRAAGFYREFVHPTEGIGGPGPRRIIVGQYGDLNYTSDHNKSFTKLCSDRRT